MSAIKLLALVIILSETNKNEAIGDVDETQFKYRGFSFTCHLIGYEKKRCLSCLAKPIKKKFDRINRKNIISRVKGKIVIDWGKYVEEYHENIGEYVEGFDPDFWKILIHLGVIRYLFKGVSGWRLDPNNPCWWLSAAGLSIVFASKEDAENYKQARWGRAIYPIDIYQVSR